jgi:hypothetical protein
VHVISPYSARTPSRAFSISTGWNRWALPISTVTVGVPAAVAARRSDPSAPGPARTTFAPNARASRSTSGFEVSARRWNIVVRLRVEVWRSSP